MDITVVSLCMVCWVFCFGGELFGVNETEGYSLIDALSSEVLASLVIFLKHEDTKARRITKLKIRVLIIL